ncbi:N-acetyllactosaminide beta-1,3-N-acetylglucosaminyltransferase [Aphelenchoides bicaudatus]|nr:N-acetyllactosaminide beta-1,3-N-acetylglucosaminyltransferase [Aphelenchoides bicaudatus]
MERNIARRGAGTQLLIIADIENIFCPNFTDLVRNETEKLIRTNEKYVLVYRRFEVENGMRKPQNVRDLWVLLKAKKASFFHAHYFPNGHYIPDLMDWLQYSVDNQTVVATNEAYNNPAWEPQLIMKSDVPFHYEDVVTRRYDHQVLIRELCRSDYQFKTLSHVFNFHIGIKRNQTGMDIIMKHIARYGGAYGNKIFVKYLDQKYPETTGACPAL